MKVWRYSRWDGTQQEFSLDADAALDALSDLMMEGLCAEEALAWMQRGGFELAGLDLRVMGVEELLEELRREAQSAASSAIAMDEATARAAPTARRDPRSRGGARSASSTATSRARMNEFLDRRHRRGVSLSDAIERFRDRDFADAEARRGRSASCSRSSSGCAQLEEFLQQRGAALPRQRSRRLRDGAADPRAHRGAASSSRAISPSGNFERSTPEQLRELLSERRRALAGPAARPATRSLRDAPAILRDGDDGTSSRRARSAGSARRRSRPSTARCARAGPGGHDTVQHGRRHFRVPTRRAPGSSATRSTSTSCARC